ncbi:hypothetical protein MSG37_01065 [Shewanella sp. 1CM18E]|uniref:hypothetical protein n=1 Tax=Shewanella sp. 1CM18E TaxID=2929169 RepID=UPI0020C0B49C|nr:hypothetical protein [Shewanella sp. 1CM18E]MCK8043463.1 hypothetical protein [Shewanella sp. 1CM18E]
MRNSLILLAKMIFAFSLLPCTSFALDSLTDAELKQKGQAFVAAKEAWQQPDSTVEDVEHYIGLLSDNFIDEYVQYKVTFAADKAKLKARLIEKLKDDVLEHQVQILQMMTGPNVVMLKIAEKGKLKPAGQYRMINIDRVSVISLEFDKQGLISHIRRHGD